MSSHNIAIHRTTRDHHSTRAAIGLPVRVSSQSSTSELLVGDLTRTELRRRVWHMGPGLLPLLLWPIPHQDPITFKLCAIICGLVLALAGAIFLHYDLIERDGEQNQRAAAVLGYSCSVALMFLLFPAQAELGMALLAILALGDGSAALGGLVFKGGKLPWNRQKTVAGFLCFVVVGTVAAAFLYWGEASNAYAQPQHVPVTIPVAILVVAPATLVGAVVESVHSRVNDNVRVGLASGVTLVVSQNIFVGWT